MIDEERKERFLLAINYLQQKRLLGTKKKVQDIVDKTGYNPTNIYSALAGETRYLNQKFVTNFCTAFNGVISPDWIMTGIGDMVCVSDDLFSSTPSIPEETLNKLTKNELVALVKQLMELHHEENELYRMLIRQNEEIIRNGQSRFNDITSLIYKNVQSDGRCRAAH